MNLDEMDRNEILSGINDGVLDDAELLELVSDNDFDIALAVANSRHSNEPILDIAAHDRDERIRYAAVNNPNCGMRTLEYLRRDSNKEIAILAIKRSNDKENQEKMRWYCEKCKTFHKENELCPQIRVGLKSIPSGLLRHLTLLLLLGRKYL